MNIYIMENAQEIGKAVGKLFVDAINKKPDITLGLATGASPIPTYKYIAEEYKKGNVSLKDVKTYNLDEYVNLPKEDKNSYYSFMHAELSYKNCESYFLDPASIVAALCLPVKDSEKILDLCAAPGGKTLVLAGNKNDDAVLFSNERSPSRKKRLSKVVESSLPPEISCNVKVCLSDGASWCRRVSECYESILLDAPCSSERHVLNDKIS